MLLHSTLFLLMLTFVHQSTAAFCDESLVGRFCTCVNNFDVCSPSRNGNIGIVVEISGSLFCDAPQFCPAGQRGTTGSTSSPGSASGSASIDSGSANSPAMETTLTSGLKKRGDDDVCCVACAPAAIACAAPAIAFPVLSSRSQWPVREAFHQAQALGKGTTVRITRLDDGRQRS
jgi:hypothetical protein